MPDAALGLRLSYRRGGAFDADEGGVISAGGVGFDISCGVRTLRTGLKRHHIEAIKETLAESLYISIPQGSAARVIFVWIYGDGCHVTVVAQPGRYNAGMDALKI